MSMLAQSAVFLGAAVIAVPLTKRLGLGAVLGYLAAGAAIGPQGAGVMVDVQDLLHFAEFGVVLLLFIIGLELQPSRLWIMRKSVFGLGTAQVAITGAVLALAGRWLGLSVETASVAGLTLALSSTAFALQTLAEKNQLTSRHGRSAFAILLFQDVAAIPLIALVPLLEPEGTGPMDQGGLLGAAQTLCLVVAVLVGGRYILRYALRIVAATRVQEVFTAMSLLTVIGTALFMHEIGLSAALGAFLAGVLLADSEYRHALQADLEPFKGLLLGLFFIAVGMSLNLQMIAANPAEIGLLVAGLVTVKVAVLFALGRMAGLKAPSARALALVLSQGGEFAFVVLGVAATAGVVEPWLADRLVAVVTLSMATTPLLLLADGFIVRRLARTRTAPAFDSLPDEDRAVIIAGFGRFGQIVARILRAKQIPFTALEASAEQVDFVRQYGAKVFYGDASRIDLLRAAHADHAVAFVLAIDDVDASVRTAAVVRENFPDLKIFARARNRNHAYRLMDLGVQVIWRETFHSALEMSRAVLKTLGLPDYDADRTVELFRHHDEQRLYAHYGLHTDEARLQALAKKAAQELEELFAADAARDREGAA